MELIRIYKDPWIPGHFIFFTHSVLVQGKAKTTGALSGGTLAVRICAGTMFGLQGFSVRGTTIAVFFMRGLNFCLNLFFGDSGLLKAN